MDNSIATIILGIIILILGIMNIRGNISYIHWYNRRKVSESDTAKYGKSVGIGTAVIGAALIVTAILENIFKADFENISLIGCLVGVIFIFYGQFKYNKGIF